ncbi:hypothetical protein ABIB75_005907 [Bradyrhizobium sp. GM2.2]|uniref:hypothetical protein n=1 Tax=unclassified Bradyrhizobium TaxID=2631580 RepID=UPI001FFA7C39|nr:hypothetical protein [Bradyrhizobium sp. 173]MCK1568335.1 hypothetical protein [Bradyrhizobium sp. 173]
MSRDLGSRAVFKQQIDPVPQTMTAGSPGLPAAAPTAMLSISTPGLELVGLRAYHPDDKLHRSRYAHVSKRAQALDLGYRGARVDPNWPGAKL